MTTEEPNTMQAAAGLTTNERDVLRYALDLAQDQIHSRINEFDEDDQAAVDALRRMVNEAPQPKTQAQPPRHRWYVEMLDDLADEWVPGTRYSVRERAVNHLNHASAIAPTWKDGTPVQRRLVRETTSYTVEPVGTEQAAEGAQR